MDVPDPFLFCVFHLDNYPKGHPKHVRLRLRMSLRPRHYRWRPRSLSEPRPRSPPEPPFTRLPASFPTDARATPRQWRRL